MITLENKKLHDLIADKDELVNSGRAISKELDIVEVKITRFEEKEKRITEKVVPPKNLTDRGLKRSIKPLLRTGPPSGHSLR